MDYRSIAYQLIDANNGCRVVENLDEFQGLDHVDIANRLIDSGQGDLVASYLDKFHGLDHSSIANRLIDDGKGRSVACFLDKFQGINHTDIANKLIDSNQGGCIAKGLDKFQGLDHVDIAHRLIDTHNGEDVAECLDEFQGLDHIDIAHRLIEAGQSWGLAINIDKFQGLSQEDIANRMIDANKVDALESCLSDFKFKDLDITIADKLLSIGESGILLSYIKCFKSLPGDKITNLLDHSTNAERIKNQLFRFTDIPEESLVELRKQLNVPELTNMPRERMGENGEIIKPSENALDRWYSNLSYTYMEGGFNKATIGHLIRLRIEHGLANDIHDASQWLSTFKIPENGYDISAILNQRESDSFNKDSIEEYSTKLIDLNSEIQFFLKLSNSDQNLRDRLNYEGIKQEISSEEKLQDIFATIPNLKNSFNTELGRSTSQLTEAFYDNILDTNPQIKQNYDNAIDNGVARRKFFKDALKSNKDLQDQLNSQREQMLTDLKNNFYSSTIQQNPELTFNIDQSKTQKSNEDWFFTPESQLLFRAAIRDINGSPLYKHADFNLEILFKQAEGLSHDFVQTTSFGVGKEETAHNLNEEQLKNRLAEMYKKIHSTPINQERLGETVRLLARTKLARQSYITDTQNWLKRHAVAPQELLTKTWGDRAYTLASGEVDSAKAINSWQSRFALDKMVYELSSAGVLQTEYDLKIADITSEKSKPIITELTRRLSTKDTIKALSKLKKWGLNREKKSVKSILPAANIPVEINHNNKISNYSFEILDKKDPRGFTIGEDTYCCMTIDGASKDCIEAGYTRENCGFVAIYNGNENLVAQSFWYINPEKPDVLVMDNIEANDGQDLQKIADVYRQSLTDYLKSHPELKITKVHVGTGYTDINLSEMPKVEPSTPLSYVGYTDAKKQRLLLNLG